MHPLFDVTSLPNSPTGEANGGSTPLVPATLNLLRGPLDPRYFDLDGLPPPIVFDEDAVRPEQGVVDVPAAALQPGLLWRLFRRGAPAVRVTQEPTVVDLWRDLMPFDRENAETIHGERLPWGASLRDLAANYRPSGCVGAHTGDVFFAAPSYVTYCARRFQVFASTESSELVVEPPVFRQGSSEFRVPAESAQSVWTLGTRLFRALSPAGFEYDNLAVALERLSYDDSLQALRERVQLIRGAGGRLSQIGHTLDQLIAESAGPFRRPWIQLAYAAANLVPALRPLLQSLNRFAAERTPDVRLEDNEEILGESHFDERLFSCLTSRREVIRTEYLTAEGWRELPLAPDSLTIFPGTLSKPLLGLEATRHRIVHTGVHGKRGGNTTILLGLSPRKR